MAHIHAIEEHVTSAVTSYNNRRDVASDILCGSALMLYDSSKQVQSSSVGECSTVEYSGMELDGEWFSYKTTTVQSL
jgi:hypothetical protein